MKINDTLLDYLAERYQAMKAAAQIPLLTVDGKPFTFERFLEQIEAHRKRGITA